MASNTPLISIIMPAYNCSNYIKQAIDSVLIQTHQNFELLISDDVSTDNTLDVIRTYQDDRIKVFTNESNQGPAILCNQLIQYYAKGEYIVRLDADDWMSHDRLELQHAEFMKNPKLSIVLGGVARYYPITNKIEDAKNYPLTNIEIRNFIEKRESIPCGGLAVMMYSRKNFMELKGFQEFFSKIGGEDIDLFLRLLRLGEVCSVNKSLYFYRYNTQSFSQTNHSNILKLNSHKLAFFLYRERQQFNGLDGLTGLIHSSFEKFKQELLESYERDRSKIFYHRIKSGNLSYADRIEACLSALKVAPLKLDLYRHLIKLFIKKITS